MEKSRININKVKKAYFLFQYLKSVYSQTKISPDSFAYN